MWDVLKGAVNGGIYIPYTAKNFPDYKAAKEKGKDPEYDTEAHEKRIFSGHVKEYMEMRTETRQSELSQVETLLAIPT